MVWVCGVVAAHRIVFCLYRCEKSGSPWRRINENNLPGHVLCHLGFEKTNLNISCSWCHPTAPLSPPFASPPPGGRYRPLWEPLMYSLLPSLLEAPTHTGARASLTSLSYIVNAWIPSYTRTFIEGTIFFTQGYRSYMFTGIHPRFPIHVSVSILL